MSDRGMGIWRLEGLFGEHHVAENIFYDFDSVSGVLGGVAPDGDAMIADKEGGNFGWG